MEFINEGSTLPPPLNIVPTPKGVYELVKKIIRRIKKKPTMNSNSKKNGHLNGNVGHDKNLFRVKNIFLIINLIIKEEFNLHFIVIGY